MFIDARAKFLGTAVSIHIRGAPRHKFKNNHIDNPFNTKDSALSDPFCWPQR